MDISVTLYLVFLAIVLANCWFVISVSKIIRDHVKDLQRTQSQNMSNFVDCLVKVLGNFMECSAEDLKRIENKIEALSQQSKTHHTRGDRPLGRPPPSPSKPPIRWDD